MKQSPSRGGQTDGLGRYAGIRDVIFRYFSVFVSNRYSNKKYSLLCIRYSVPTYIRRFVNFVVGTPYTKRTSTYIEA